jgi:cell division protein FtsI/penicillin-binding protein 2
MFRNVSRVSWLTYVFLLIWLLIIGRLFYVQVIKHDYYSTMAERQYLTERTIYPDRGQIFVSDKADGNYPVAINKTYFMFSAAPKEIKHPDNAFKKKSDADYEPQKDADFKKELSAKLGEILKMPADQLFSIIGKEDDPYERIKKALTDDEAKKIKELNVPGLILEKKSLRYYPFNNFASHVLGFVGYKNDQEGAGVYGIEGFYEDILSGIKGHFKGEKDTRGIWIPVSDKEFTMQENGSDIYLTIDYNIQLKAEQVLKDIMEKWKPQNASIIVEVPSTGAIKAMATLPAFDPNKYNEIKNFDSFQNPLVEKLFEPGSIFKPLTASIALNEGKVTEKTTYTDTGAIKIGRYTIENFHEKKYGLQTMTEVIEKSLNTGAVYMQQSVDKPIYKSYLEKYGLDTKTGIDLAGEVSGNLSNLNTTRDIEYATASFGQGVSMTPIEIFQALASIANKGTVMKPYLVDKILNADGSVQQTEPTPLIKNIVKPETALAVSRMMVSAVQNTYVKKMGVPGYTIAAKTGTAQIPDKGGYLDRSQTIQSLVSFFPAFSPKYVVMIKMDKPEGSDAAGNSLPGYMKDMMVFLINYRRIPPDNPTAPTPTP